ncbi:hypothetical protein I4U23_005179 [Adineta vaga]|nr:hypothetical protein I4U23_005179 [Adineta vaga]
MTQKDARASLNRLITKTSVVKFQIVCFDVNEKDAKMTVNTGRLRTITDSIEFFNTATKCIEHLEQTKSMDTFIIVCEQRVEDFIPKIPIQENIRVIYVMHQNYESDSCDQYRERIREHGKVRQDIYTTFDDLLNSLQIDVIYYLFSDKHYNFDMEKIGQSTESLIKPWFQEFIDILCKISYPEDQLQKLIPLLRQYTTSKEVDTFECEYKIKGAIYYYTKETFIYELLNQLLRQRNIYLLFKFGFFIKDLYQELREAQKEFIKNFSNQPHLRPLYRGQMMPKTDIDGLIGDLYIQNTQMFSSSSAKNVSLMFQNSGLTRDSFLQNVIFEIEVDVRKRTAPYADIQNLSQFQSEREVLFMVGNRFRVEDVKFTEEGNYHLVKLVSLNDLEPMDLRISTDYCDRRNLKNCISTLAFQMYYISPTDLCMIYDELMNLYPSEKWIKAVKSFRLGQHLQYKGKEYHSALMKYHHALEIWLRFIDDRDLNCSIDIGHVYYQIGICHEYLGSAYNIIKENFDHAQTYYQTAYNNSRSEHEQTETINHLAYIYVSQMELHSQDSQMLKEYGSMAYKYRRQFIKKIRQNELYDKLKVAESVLLLALICKQMKDYDEMLNSYKMALDIYQQHDVRDQTSINLCLSEIVKIYKEQKKDFNLAITYQKLKHDIRLKYNEPKEEDGESTSRHKKQRIRNSHLELAKLYKKNKQYTLASEHKLLANGSDEDETSDETDSNPSLIDI